MNPFHILQKEKCTYSIQKPEQQFIEDLKRKIGGYHCKNLNIEGGFTTSHVLEFYPKRQIHIRNFETKAAYLYGEIKSEGNKTKVDFWVRPNTLFPALFFVFLLFGVLFFMVYAISGVQDFLYGGIAFAVFCPLTQLLLAYIYKALLKKNFIRLMEIKL